MQAQAAPPYADPTRFREEAVTVGAGEWALPGTLTRPRGGGPAPGVVLVHGSGPGDRDETVGPNRPFRDLAWGLASRGIAVLRYDKRTRVHAARMAQLPTLTVKDETIDDALAAVALLRQTPGVDPRHIFVIGHSLGATLAPRIAAADPQLAGIVLLAGGTRKMEEMLVQQADYLTSVDSSIAPRLAPLREGAARIRALTPADSARPGFILGAPAAYWLDLRAYDILATARAIATPMLVLQGERDYQATREDFEALQRGLAQRPDVRFRLFPALNHLFIAGEGRSMPAEYAQPGIVAEEVVTTIAGWIGEISGRGARHP